MLDTLLILAIALAALWAFARFFLAGADLAAYDSPAHLPVIQAADVSPEHDETVAFLRQSAMTGTDRTGTPAERLRRLRQAFEDALPRHGAPAEITSVDAGGVPAEWVCGPGADPDRRLLYIHGGAFVLCSPATHRGITTHLSQLAGAAVLSIDYRLQPEHARKAMIEDCQNAYRWMLEHGPQGAGPAGAAFVAGDSAGGTLTLGLIAWVRDAGLRPPDAAVAVAPLTDATLGSPSLKRNLDTDPLLGPGFRRLARVPRTVQLYASWLNLRMRPCSPPASPVYGDLAGLPPLLIQASEAEIMIDDSRRYANKAASQGTDVTLETWPKLVHVWHFFDQPETHDAFERIADFLERHAPRTTASA